MILAIVASSGVSFSKHAILWVVPRLLCVENTSINRIFCPLLGQVLLFAGKTQILAILEAQHALGVTAPPPSFKRPSICTSWGTMPTNSFTSWCARHAPWALAPFSLVTHCSRSRLTPCFLAPCLGYFFCWSSRTWTSSMESPSRKDLDLNVRCSPQIHRSNPDCMRKCYPFISPPFFFFNLMPSSLPQELLDISNIFLFILNSFLPAEDRYFASEVQATGVLGMLTI